MCACSLETCPRWLCLSVALAHSEYFNCVFQLGKASSFSLPVKLCEALFWAGSNARSSESVSQVIHQAWKGNRAAHLPLLSVANKQTKTLKI